MVKRGQSGDGVLEASTLFDVCVEYECVELCEEVESKRAKVLI